MREIPILQPIIVDSGVIIQFTTDFILEKTHLITIPAQYTAIIIKNEQLFSRIKPCVKRNLSKTLGKDALGKTIKIAFVLNQAIAEMSWGFGNIHVYNERLKETYRVGVNGKLDISIADYSKLINTFPMEGHITVEALREKLISIIKTVGTSIVSACFANTDISVLR